MRISVFVVMNTRTNANECHCKSWSNRAAARLTPANAAHENKRASLPRPPARPQARSLRVLRRRAQSAQGGPGAAAYS